jgi:hypothetical protein
MSPNEIPYGYCHCGCGEKTRIARVSIRSRGQVRGQPMRFLPYHYSQFQKLEPDIPDVHGFCECGCGKITGHPKRGRNKNIPYRFVMGHSRRRSPEQFREWFWSMVDIKEPDECWVWKAGLADTGYGGLSHLNKTATTHVVAWELTNGPVPDGLCVLHKCDNRPCCNPNHLFLGTKKDNTQDMVKKGRWANQYRRGSAAM